MAVTLVVSTHGESPQSITLDQPRIVVGRGAAADVRLPSRGVSTQHAVIHVAGSEAWVVDEGSTNGTRVNGTVVPRGRKKALHGGDVLSVGAYDIRVTLTTAMADPPERTGTLARKLLGGALRTVGSTAAPPQLVLTTGKRAGQTWEVTPGRVVLGRGDDCEVLLDDPDCSRHHAEVARDDDGATLRDLGSRNGVFVAGRRQTERRLKHGDEITIGRTTVRFHDPTEELLRAFDTGGDEPAPPPPAPQEVPTVEGPTEAVTALTSTPPVARTDRVATGRSVVAPPTGRTVDWIVVALALVILVVSVAGLWLVLRSTPGR